MKIQSINNSNSFKARLPKAEVKNLIEESRSIPLGLPKLYTLLKYMDKIPTSYLNFVKHKSNKQYLLNNQVDKCDYFLVDKNSTLGHSAESKFQALENACIKDNLVYKKYAYMSKSVYENQYLNNRNKTEEDVLKISLDA